MAEILNKRAKQIESMIIKIIKPKKLMQFQILFEKT